MTKRSLLALLIISSVACADDVQAPRETLYFDAVVTPAALTLAPGDTGLITLSSGTWEENSVQNAPVGVSHLGNEGRPFDQVGPDPTGQVQVVVAGDAPSDTATVFLIGGSYSGYSYYTGSYFLRVDAPGPK